MRELTIDRILRPNLIIYLDAPTSVVQEKIRERASTTHPWEKNSPVWENTAYMEAVYQRGLAKYLNAASSHSEVLSYDWSEGGDFEVVVEDLEALNLDYHDKYDKMQKDWRLLTEDAFGTKRYVYTQAHSLLKGFHAPFFSADKLWFTPEEGIEIEKVQTLLPGNLHQTGFNTDLGDPEPFMSDGFAKIRANNYTLSNAQQLHASTLRDDVNHEREMKIAANRKALGDEKWWLV